MIPIRDGFLSRRTRTRPLNGEKGQASIEFILTFAFGIGFTLLFVGLAFNMTRGYLVHYANFMASRTFLSHDAAGTGSVQLSLDRAADRADDTLDSYPLAAFNLSPEFKVNKPIANSALMSGTTLTFRERITPFSMVGGDSEAVFHSESFLGKEPVKLQCLFSICQLMGLGECNSKTDVTVFDNGC